MGHWSDILDERTRKHIDFARAYANRFAHGAPGHMDLMTIARLSELIDNAVYRGDITKDPPKRTDLLTPAEKVEVDPSRPPDVSKRPKGFA